MSTYSSFIFLAVQALIWKWLGLVCIHIYTTGAWTYRRESIWNKIVWWFFPCWCTSQITANILTSVELLQNLRKNNKPQVGRKPGPLSWSVKKSNHDIMYKSNEIWAKWNFSITTGTKVIVLQKLSTLYSLLSSCGNKPDHLLYTPNTQEHFLPADTFSTMLQHSLCSIMPQPPPNSVSCIHL